MSCSGFEWNACRIQIESITSSGTVAEFAEMSCGGAKPVRIRCPSAKTDFLCGLLNIPGENEVFQAFCCSEASPSVSWSVE